MKKLLTIFFFLFSIIAGAQGPPTSTYTKISTTGYNWTQPSAFTGGLHLPTYGDTALAPRQWRGAGATLIDTTGDNKGLYVWYDGYWHQVGSAAPAPAADTVQVLGTWENQPFTGPSIPSGWTAEGGYAPAYSNGVTLSPNSGTSFQNGCIRMNTKYTASQNYSYEIPFVVGTKPLTWANGMQIGGRSRNGRCSNAFTLRTANGGTTHKIVFSTFFQTDETRQDSTAAISITNGDTLILRAYFTPASVYYTLVKIVNGVESLTDHAGSVYKYINLAESLQQPANTRTIFLTAIGAAGSYKVLNFHEKHYDRINADMVFVGNSILTRFNASDLSQHWVAQTMRYSDKSWVMLAGGGDGWTDLYDREAEVIAHAKAAGSYVVIELGTNDGGSDIRTWGKVIMQDFIDAGITPIFLKVFSETAKDTVAYNVCRELGVKLIDAKRSNFPNMSNTHPYDLGNEQIAAIVAAEIPDIIKQQRAGTTNIATIFASGENRNRIEGAQAGAILFNSIENTNRITADQANALRWIDSLNFLDINGRTLSSAGVIVSSGIGAWGTGYSGVGMSVEAGIGMITAFNGTSGTFQPVGARGSTVTFQTNGTTTSLSGNSSNVWTAARGMIINEDGLASDTRIESDGDANAVFVNGTTNNVGIGTATPVTKLNVNGTISATAASGTGADSIAVWHNGVLAGVAGTGATPPAGSNRNIQINDNGVFGAAGSDSLNWSGGALTSKGSVGVGTTSPTARLHIGDPGSTAANNGQFKLAANTNQLATPESGVMENAGVKLQWTYSNGTRATVQTVNVFTSSGNESISVPYSYFIFTGSTATWTLPPVAGSNNANVKLSIKNRGSGNLTINSNAGGNDIYSSSAVNTVTITPGSAVEFVNDGTYWVMF